MLENDQITQQGLTPPALTPRERAFDMSGVERGPDGIARYVDRPQSLVAMLRATTERCADREAFAELDGDRITFAELWERAARVAGGLRASNVQPGDRVAIRMLNSVDWCVAFYGIVMAGAVAVPINTRLVENEVADLIYDSGAKLTVLSDRPLPDGKPFVAEDQAPDDLTAIFYTSGTTGAPKGAMMTHANLLASVESGLRTADTPAGGEFRGLASVPMFHIMGCAHQVILNCQVGAPLSILPAFDVKSAMRAVREHGVDRLVGVPTMFWLLLDHPEFGKLDSRGIGAILYGGAPIAPELIARLREAFPNAGLRNGFGLTETSGSGTLLPDAYADSHPHSVGFPAPVMDVDLLDPDEESGIGELLMRGPNVVSGYWNKPRETDQTLIDGWLRTGDMARIDEDGLIEIVDRKKDMVSRGGEKVFCVEVENALTAHPSVLEVGVVGVPDEVMGERVGAAVVPRSGLTIEPDELLAFAKARLADFKVPEYLTVRDELLPRNAGGKVLKTVLRDQVAQRALADAQEQFAKAFENAPIGMALVRFKEGGEQVFMRVNRALCDLSGYPGDELVGSSVGDLLLPDERDEARRLVQKLLSEDAGMHSLEHRYLRRGGQVGWVASNLSIVRDRQGRALYGISQIQDVTKRRELDERMRYLADHDPLTGLLNRRRFEEELERETELARRHGRLGTVLVVDLDGFKYVNDSFGHDAGDELIRAVADELKESCRSTDLVARMGGDEFAMLLPETEIEGGERLARKLIGNLRDRSFAVGRSAVNVRITASIGVASFGPDGPAPDEVLVAADLAMYSAKEGGRDSAATHSDENSEDPGGMSDRLAWVNRIKDALANDSFLLYRQPILDVRKGSIAHDEVLLRMLDDEGNVCTPDSFLPVAEATGLMRAVDRWVLAHAIEIAAGREPDAPGLCINVSSQSVTDPALPDFIEQEIRRHGADPDSLTFEVTETAAISNLSEAESFITHLHGLGCHVALDDFGAGHGSFSYLKNLDFDMLKIDGQFIENLPDSPDDQVIVRSIVATAKGLGKETVAEFVGDDQTITLLRGLGVDFGQGFHIAKPGPIEPLSGGSSSDAPAA
ncbi:MAG: AMP-binding protein [Thermoleophilaceae bacterium]